MDSGRNGCIGRDWAQQLFNEKVKNYYRLFSIELPDQHPDFRSDQIIENGRM